MTTDMHPAEGASRPNRPARTGMRGGLLIRHRVLLLPALATAALAAVFLVNQIAAARTTRLVDQVAVSDFGAWETYAWLDETLIDVQRGLQAAVAASEVRKLAETDSLKDAALARLRQAAVAGALPPDAAARQAAAFDGYYTLARGTTERMITSAGAEDLTEQLAAMGQRFNALKASLDSATAAAPRTARARFAAVRASQRQAALAQALTGVACLAALAWLTIAVIRSISAPLREATRVASQLARRSRRDGHRDLGRRGRAAVGGDARHGRRPRRDSRGGPRRGVGRPVGRGAPAE